MSFPLSLRVWPAAEESLESLGSLVERINQERDHFRNITEDGLLNEIEVAEAISSVDDAEEVKFDKIQDAETRRKELYTAREEMLKFVRQAQNEALTALDFMSLLISRDAPRQADLSLSPFLKQAIPAGTLNFDNTQASKPTTAQDDLAKNISVGWNFKSLNSAADRLLMSATRLGEEMTREAGYWEGILSVSEKGWSVCRMPRESHTVGVRFGSSEAAPIFGAQGFAALRPDAAGKVFLDQSSASEPSCIRVRLVRDGQISGTSLIPSLDGLDQAPLETLIHKARDSLFEAELYQEMTREARSLLSYGVNVVDDKIYVPARLQRNDTAIPLLQNSYELIIDKTPLAESAGNLSSTDSSLLANAIAVTLRILLTYAYRCKFRLRSQPPPPLSSEKQKPPVQRILQPILCHMLHEEQVRGLQTMASNLVGCLQSAGLQASLSVDTSPLENILQKRSTLTSMEMLVAALCAPLHTRMTLDSPITRTCTLDVTTHLSAPTNGSLFKTSCPVSAQGTDSPTTMQFHELAEVQRHVSDMVCAVVARHISASESDWMLEASGSSLRKVFASPNRTKRITIEHDEKSLALFWGWEGETPRVAEVWQSEKREKQQDLASVMERMSNS